MATTTDQEKSILKEAHQLVFGDRGADYGHPHEDFSRTARLWSSVIDHHFTPQEVGLLMILLKVSREFFSPKRDNLVDVAGYAQTVDLVNEREKALKVERYVAAIDWLGETDALRDEYSDDHLAPGDHDLEDAPLAPWELDLLYPLFVTDPDGERWVRMGPNLYTWVVEESDASYQLATEDDRLIEQTREYVETGGYRL